MLLRFKSLLSDFFCILKHIYLKSTYQSNNEENSKVKEKFQVLI